MKKKYTKDPVIVTLKDGSTIYQHRLLMEDHLGRVLHEDEVVHAKDGNYASTDVKNFKVYTRAELVRLHHKWGGPRAVGYTYSEEELIEAMKRVYHRFGKCTSTLFNANTNINAQTVKQRFGSWAKAKKMAGIDTSSKEFYLKQIRKTFEYYGKCTPDEVHAYTGICYRTIIRRFKTWENAKKLAGIVE